MSQATMERIAALDAERSSVLLRALREQAEQTAELSARVSQLELWRVAALDEMASLRAELRQPGCDGSASISSASGSSSIVIRSASGALAMRRRGAPRSAPGTPLAHAQHFPQATQRSLQSPTSSR